MLIWAALALIFCAVAAGSLALSRILPRLNLIDRPVARSSHDVPTPRGGGIAPVMALLAAMAWLAARQPDLGLQVLAVAALGLAILSLRDDIASLAALPRLGGHALAVAAGVWTATVFWPTILPEWQYPALRAAGLFLCWLWFVNLFNFMDGIDGLSGLELGFIGLGAAAVAAFGPLWTARAATPFDQALVWSGLTLAAAAGGFLVANWHPARVFLGDVGSVPLGFIAGGLLVALAAAGHASAAAILPAYYVVDATATLLRRMAAGERLADAHRSHAYQRAVQAGLSHAQVCAMIAVVNCVLLVLAVLSGWQPALCLVAAYLAAGAAYAALPRLAGVLLARRSALAAGAARAASDAERPS